MEIQEIAKALQLKDQLEELRPLDKEQEARIMQKFRLDWNYHSNHLEGNSLNYGETKALLLFGITAQGKPLKDHFEITGHDEAIKWVIEVIKDERPLTESFIREIHKLLLKESSEKDAITPDGIPTKRRIEVGKYKTTPNHVRTQTGEIFYFASPEETPAKMHDLMEWYRQEKSYPSFNAISFAAKFHYDFIRIHPFDDGNGRTARILMNFILMQNGFPPVIIKTEEKENYFAVLRMADAGQLEPFIEYIAQNLNRSLEIMIKGAKGESIEDPDDLDKELALLEQRLKGIGKRATIGKSYAAIEELFERCILPFKNYLVEVCSKYDKFYISKEFNVYNDFDEKYDQEEHFKKVIKLNIKDPSGIYISDGLAETVTINYQHFTFKNTDIIINVYTIKFRFEFLSNMYKLTSNNITIFEKLYDEYLTDEEIKTIVKRETDAHKAFIERKIKEAGDSNRL